MRGNTCFCLALFLSFAATAQQKEIDSILVQLNTHTKEDTVRFTLLNDLAYWYSIVDPDKGIQAADRAIDLANKLHNQKALAAAYSQKGLNYDAKSEDSLAMLMYEQALNINKAIDNKKGQARALNNIALIYVNTSQYDKALECHRQAYQIFEAAGDSVRMAGSLANAGVVYNYLADYPKAMENYLRALSIEEKLGRRESSATTMGNIGIIYKKWKKNDLALHYYTKALAILETSGNKIQLANTLNNIGSVYDEMDSTEKAFRYYNRSLDIYRELDNKRGIANNLTDLGVLYSGKEAYLPAIKSCMEAIKIYEELDDKTNFSVVLNAMGEIILKAPAAILMQTGFSPGNRFNKAQEYVKRSLAIATESEAPDRQATAWQLLSETYAAQKDFSKALDAYKQYTHLEDSIFNDEKKEEIIRQQIQFEQDKKDAILAAEHAAEQKQQQTIKNFLVALAGIILLTSVLLFFSYKRRRDAIAKRNDAELKAQITDTELKVMRLQMNPHFIFNSLNSIGDYIAKNNPQEADAYLSKFARVMRMTLENSEQQAIPLEDDLKALELYMQLEAKRLNNKFTYEINVAADIDKENTLVPPMIFQPFIENSIWHGISRKEGKGHIVVDIRKEGQMLSCSIDDDGIGRDQAESMKKQQADKKQSLGMRITKARIEILNRLKGSNATVQLIDKPQGVRAELKLPAETNF